MSRDWDKLRRQDKVDKYRSQPPLTREQKRRIQKARDLKFRLSRSGTHNHAPKYTEPAATFYRPSTYRIVTIDLPQGQSRACFRIRHNPTHAELVWADPALEWFTRIRHPAKIAEWLAATDFRYIWGPSLSKAPTQTDSQPPGPSVETPAEAYPLKYASHPQGGNTGPTLNTQPTRADIPGSSMPTQEPQVGRSGMAYPVLAA